MDVTNYAIICDISQIWYRGPPVLPENFTLASPPPQLTHSSQPTQHLLIMSTNWSVSFDETLAEYIVKYTLACGDPAARAQILLDCQEDIINSPLCEEQDIELPQHLCQVIISFHRVTSVHM